MVKLDRSFQDEDFECVGVVDMTSVIFIVGNKLFVDLDDLVPDLETYDYDPDETEAERKERRRKYWALVAVINGYEILEMELNVKVIFIHNNCYYAAGDLFDV